MAQPFACPLPTGDRDDLWESSPLGIPTEWPAHLQAHVQTVASFSYPAAILWSEQLVLLANAAWFDAAANDVHQGQTQRGRLGADAWQAVGTALRAGEPARMESGHFLEDGEVHTVLLSPLFGGGKEADKAVGLLAQLLPKPKLGPQENTARHVDHHDESHAQACHPDLDTNELNRTVQNVPLDQHAFFHRFAEMLPSGLAILDHKADAVFVNQQFYQLTTHYGDDQAFESWPQSIHPDDYDRVMETYQHAFDNHKQLRTEFRASGHQRPWRVLLLMPIDDEHLEHVSLREYGGFVCSIVDITCEKSAELAERDAAKEANRRKEQQERFIDMISHEIRNPLSAIIHCAEDIEEALKGDDTITSVGQIREALETIHLCLQHQRNIVDDVLSFSKLEASMLLLRPKPSRPSVHLAKTMKIFHPEFRKQKLSSNYRVDDPYKTCRVEQVMADESRIAQILVNLLSNALKFTSRKDGEKKIEVRVGASHDRPTSYPPDVVFFNPEDTALRMDMTEQAEWGDGDAVYVMVAVKDTGIGISDEGQKRLFERFHQATPKTELNYGGSGLGLNICRKICQLHGGEIGVSSKEGQGSTFGFFVKVRRCESTITRESSEDQQEVGTREGDDLSAPQLAPQDESNSPTAISSLNPPYLDHQAESPESRWLAACEGHDNASKATKQQTGPKSTAGESEPHATQGSEDPGGVSTSSSKRTHVLLVEDNIINQKVLRRKLEARLFRVTTANNGREAVDAVSASREAHDGPDIILMDEHMPVLDGSGATKQIRQQEREEGWEQVPILGLTANVRDEQKEEMIRSGMDDVISKPYKTEEMVERLERLVKRNAGSEQS